MSEKNYDDLIKKYPLAFNDEYCSIACETGWYDLFESMAKEITKANQEWAESEDDEKMCVCNYYLAAHINRTELESIEGLPCDNFNLKYPVLMSAKEKFAGLRLDFIYHNDETYKIQQFYESLSYCICEYCGLPGEVRSDLSWLKTLCNSCYQESLEYKKKQQIK